MQLNDYEGAQSAFARAITLKPGYAAAMQNASLTETCTFSSPGESLIIPHVSGTPELTLDPDSQLWKSAAFRHDRQGLHAVAGLPGSRDNRSRGLDGYGSVPVVCMPVSDAESFHATAK